MSEINISEMNKDDLATYALAEFGLELDKHKSLKLLRGQVQAELDKKNGVVKEPAKRNPPASEFLRHPTNGRVYKSTKHLLSRKDMIPCDEDGNTVAVASADDEE